MNIIGAEDEYLDGFQPLVDNWLDLFFSRMKLSLTQNICARGKSECPGLFGSNVIDLLECILDCKKDVIVNIDSGGWCYIKGQYKVNGTFLGILPGETSGLEPLSVKQQAELHHLFWDLARLSNNYYLWRLRRYEEFDINFRNGLYRIDFALSTRDFLYRKLYSDAYEDKFIQIIKVDLKCRKELAPVDLLLKLLKEQSHDENEDESAPGAHTVQDPSPDLELKLQIESQIFLKDPGTVHKRLIRQRHTLS
jgi:hypothetical protein